MEREELFSRYLDNNLSEKERGDLIELLQSVEGRRQFHHFMDESSHIAHYLNQDLKVREEDRVFSELVKRSEDTLMRSLTTDIENSLIGVPSVSAVKPKILLAVSLLSLAAMLVFTFVWSRFGVDQQVDSEIVRSVARVVSLDGQANVSVDAWLTPQGIVLKSGKMEVEFDNGARVLLQGSCEFRVETSSRAFLTKGQLSAFVPVEAVGFVVNTPQGSVVDLGTEFALSVESGEGTDVHVFSGEVEVAPHGSRVRVLKTEESVRLDTYGGFGQVTKTKIDDFIRLERRAPTVKTAYIYWPFENVVEQQLKDRGNGGFGEFFNLKSEDVGLTFGKHGQALSLNGKGQYLKSDFQGIGGATARTISFWLKVPPAMKSGEHYAIVAWGRVAHAEKWQLGINFLSENGVVGAIRTEFAKGYVIGSRDLRDGRWHHVSSVYIGGDSADVATHVRHYIDGKLEGVSGFQSVKINTSVDEDSEPVMIGKYINKESWFFRGAIDEMYIFNRALTPAQIVLLRDRQLEVE